MNCEYCKDDNCRCCCPGINCQQSWEDELCSGPVSVVDEESDGEDYYWVHMCEYHADKYLYRK